MIKIYYSDSINPDSYEFKDKLLHAKGDFWRIREVVITGEELKAVNQLTNLRKIKNASQLSYFGDDARFIVANVDELRNKFEEGK